MMGNSDAVFAELPEKVSTSKLELNSAFIRLIWHWLNFAVFTGLRYIGKVKLAKNIKKKNSYQQN